MSDKKKVCDLCGLAVEVEGFTLTTNDGEKSFCCEGCRGIFLMLHEDQVVSNTDKSSEN